MLDRVLNVFTSQTTPVSSPVALGDGEPARITVSLVANGAATATIDIFGSLNAERGFAKIATFNLSTPSSGEDTLGYVTDYGWPYMKATLVSISGSGANVSMWLGF